VRLSANGAYAALLPGTDSPFSLLDLNSGQRTVIAGWQPLGDARRIVSGSGEVLVAQPGRLGVWRNGEVEVLREENVITDATIDDSGRFVAYYRQLIFNSEVRLIDRLSGQTSAWPQAAKPRLSSDGATLAFLAFRGTWQLVVTTTSDPSAVPITAEAGGIRDFAISGDGNVVFASTEGGRLLRIDLSSQQVLELTGPVPLIRDATMRLAPGSSFRLQLFGLSPERRIAPEPLPETFAGVRVLLNSRPAPVYVVGPDEVIFQVPWEFAEDEATVVVESQSALFETEPVAFPVRPVALFFAAPPIHEAFDSFVTAQNPAAPGEALHLYMTGLGEVAPPVPTGISAAAEPLSRTTGPLRCLVGLENGAEADVLYAGLAPGLVGYYQVDVRLPMSLPPGQTHLLCQTPASQAAVLLDLPGN
jgi:uncharacterized protein (TIGR03437 family)